MTWPEIYICHYGHEYDQIFTENLEQYFKQSDVASYALELNAAQRDAQLCELLRNPNAVVLGYNSQLDHSYINGQHFIGVAASRKIPVIQWILDHPATRWVEFSQKSHWNSAFLLNTEYAKGYFNRFCMPGANAGLMGGVGPNKRSRLSATSKQQFFARPGKCLIALGLKRIGKSIEQTLSEISLLDASVANIINRSVDTARFDLEGPLEAHLIENLEKCGAVFDVETFNSCFRMMEDCVQAFRRLIIFETARRYPVCILSDDSAALYAQGAAAEFCMNVSMESTLSGMPNFRSVLSVSPINDLIHDRTMNAVNAGCIPIVEDNAVHRRIFEHKNNALMFRYEDNSLDDCLNIVCNDPEKVWEIAKRAFTLRDDPRVFCVSFDNVIEVGARQLSELRGRSSFILEGSWDEQPSGLDNNEAASGSEPLGTKDPVRERKQLGDVKRTGALGTGALEREIEIKGRLEGARAAVILAQSTSVTLGANLRSKNDELAALQRQIELTRGEAELVAERLEIEIAEAKGEAVHLRARLSLLVEQLKQVQLEYRRIVVSTLDAVELSAFNAPATPKTGLRKLAQAISERDERVLKLGQEIIDLDSRICTLRQELVRRHNRILNLEQAVSNRNNHISELGQEVATRDGRILELGQEVATRDGRILELEQQFGKLVNSSSWRITAPLRSAIGYMSAGQVRLLRRIVRRVIRSAHHTAPPPDQN